MAKQFRKTDSGLFVPGSYGEGLIRRRPTTRKNFIFTPGGGPAPGCHCGCSSLCGYTCDEDQYPNYTGPVSEDYLIEIEDVTADGCADCDDLNDGFIAEWVGTYEWPYDDDYYYCLWQHEFENPICSFTHLSLMVTHWDAYEYQPAILLTNNASIFSATLRVHYDGGLMDIKYWNEIDRDTGHFFANLTSGWNAGTPTCSFNTWLGGQSFAYLTSQ